MTRDEMKIKLEGTLSPKRFIHSVNVMNTAVELAKRYNVDLEKAAVAGLLHDCAREIRGEAALEHSRRFGIQTDYITQAQPELLHGPIGSHIARLEYGIDDEGILKAIHNHTTGRENMDMLEKIVFIADYIEPNRNFPGVEEARREAVVDLDRAVILALNKTIKHVMTKGALIHPETVSARNYLIKGYGRVPMNFFK